MKYFYFEQTLLVSNLEVIILFQVELHIFITLNEFKKKVLIYLHYKCY